MVLDVGGFRSIAGRSSDDSDCTEVGVATPELGAEGFENNEDHAFAGNLGGGAEVAGVTFWMIGCSLGGVGSWTESAVVNSGVFGGRTDTLDAGVGGEDSAGVAVSGVANVFDDVEDGGGGTYGIALLTMCCGGLLSVENVSPNA